MKKVSIIFLFLICCLTTLTKNQYTKNQDYIPVEEEEELVDTNKISSTVKSHIFRFAFLSLAFLKKQEIAQAIKKHPYITMSIIGLLAKYAIDSYNRHNAIKKDFNILLMIQELYDLILYATEINNIMVELSPPTRSFDTKDHFSAMAQGLPYTFDELERITKHILIKWKLKLKQQYPIIFKSHHKIQKKAVTYIKDIDDEIFSFYKNPLESYQQACSKIALKIRIILHKIIKLNIINSL